MINTIAIHVTWLQVAAYHPHESSAEVARGLIQRFQCTPWASDLGIVYNKVNQYPHYTVVGGHSNGETRESLSSLEVLLEVVMHNNIGAIMI
jgi:hypothetical protein